MFTIRNMGGVSLFLFGTTFLWLTPMFASKGVSTQGVLWATTRALALMTLAGFVVATWGLFQRSTWWESVAVASAVLGLAALLPYSVAAVRSGEVSPGFNVLIHAVGCAGVLVLVLVPQLEHWVDAHVMGT
ncbi:MAG TPA: hypothetical protein VFU85_11845 [Nocardioides sp.]|nr:hypothetical protein [Nocardioides sp.]